MRSSAMTKLNRRFVAEPIMKFIKTFFALGMVAALCAGSLGAAAKTQLTCCEKAAADGKECTHKCCVAAHKDGKSCKHCNPDGQDLKVKKSEKKAEKKA